MSSPDLEYIRDSLAALAKFHRDHPYDCLYEADVQAWLARNLADRFSNCPLSLTPPDIQKFNLQHVEINRVKTEYPSSTRFDVAIMSTAIDNKKKVWNQPVSCAIEMKLWQVDGTGGGIAQDLDKLQQYHRDRNQNGTPFTGIALIVCHPAYDWKKVGFYGWEKTRKNLSPTPILPDDGIAVHVIDGRQWLSALHID